MTAMPRVVTPIERLDEAGLVARAEQILPVIQAHAAETEQARTVAKPAMQAVFDSTVLRYFQPQRFGGYELDWGVQVKLGRALAKVCGSTSWLACVVGSHSAYIGRMSPQAQEEVWGPTPDVLIATGSVSRGVKIRRVDGGFSVTGRWSFCSGVDHATWALTRATPEGESEHAQYYFLYPTAEARIEDDWFVSGLRGTGSKTIVVEDVFVPNHRAMRLTELMSPNPPGSTVNPGYVYSYNFRPFAGTALMGPIIGASEAIVQAFVAALKGERVDIAVKRNVRDVNLQLLVSEALAEVSAASCLTDSIIARQQHYAKANLSIPKDQRIALLRDRTFAARLCFNAADRIVSHLDVGDILNEGYLQRQFRDLCAMLQQVGVNWDRNMANCGKATFGLPSDIPYFNAV